MDNNNRRSPLLPLISLASTKVIVVIVFVLATFSLMSLLSSYGDHEQHKYSEGDTGAIAMCQPKGKFDRKIFDAKFENAGAFSGKAQAFVDAAEKNKIDPVLMSAIAFHETGNGTSKMVVNRNNPGGLYNSSSKSFFVFSTLEEGLDFMARNLYKLYISQGLFTVEQIGAKYAPIGVKNDPNNLNAHWIPNISKRVAEFGGLTMNCESVGFASGLVSPVKSPYRITSRYGSRPNPTGVNTGSGNSDYDIHTGIDFGCVKNDPIYSVLDGKVILSQFHVLYGNYVKIQHGDKVTLYAHMTKSIVKVGDTIKQGKQIGMCGTTGNSTGPHLHFEVFVSGGTTRVDPYPYFENKKEKK